MGEPGGLLRVRAGGREDRGNVMRDGVERNPVASVNVLARDSWNTLSGDDRVTGKVSGKVYCAAAIKCRAASMGLTQT